MKKKIATLILTIASTMVFAQDVRPEQKLNLDTKMTQKSYGYLRMAVSDSQLPTEKMESLPGIGVGYRLAAGSSTFDFSASYNRRDIRSEEGTANTYFYTLPKANYLYYLSAAANNSLYGGGGLALGGMKTKDEKEFHGLISNLVLGYEMNRQSALHTFLQIEGSVGAIPAVTKNGYPGPFVEVSVGAGF